MSNIIADEVTISNSAKVESSTLKYYSRLKDYTELYNSTLGEYSYISQYSIVNKSIIGKFCSIANGCYIGLWEHNIEVSTHSFYLYEHSGNFVKGYKNYDKDNIETTIGNDVWIGANVVIKKEVLLYLMGLLLVLVPWLQKIYLLMLLLSEILLELLNIDIKWLLDIKWWDFLRDKLKEIIEQNGFNNFELFKKLLQN